MLGNTASPLATLTLPVSAIKLPTLSTPTTSIEETPLTTTLAIVTLSINTSAFVDEIATLPFVEVSEKSATKLPATAPDSTSIDWTPVITPKSIVTPSINTPAFDDVIATLPLLVEVIDKSSPPAPICAIVCADVLDIKRSPFITSISPVSVTKLPTVPVPFVDIILKSAPLAPV